MDSSHRRRPRSWFLAAFAAVVLFLGSVVLAASASAKDAPGTTPRPDRGGAATAHTTTHPAKPGPHTTGGGGSAVSLARPNGFQAQSDPDGMTNGGVDQPGGTGGVDTTTQDGNNGSGNDTDCEDDNRGVGVPGHCKHRTDQGQHTGDQTGTTTGTTTGDQTGTPGTTAGNPAVPDAILPVLAPVLPDLTTTQTATTAQVSAPGGDSSVFVRDHAVAGSTHAAASAAARPTVGVLPNTGAGAALLALTLGGLAALVVGGGLLRRSRATA